jgi:hypothetical protein
MRAVSKLFYFFAGFVAGLGLTTTVLDVIHGEVRWSWVVGTQIVALALLFVGSVVALKRGDA